MVLFVVSLIHQTNKAMTNAIRTAIEVYLSIEKSLNSEIEKYQTAVACEFEEKAAIHSERIDLIEANLEREVKTNAIAFKMTEVMFIDLVIEFESRRAA